jgi:CHAD domain-containing protein
MAPPPISPASGEARQFTVEQARLQLRHLSRQVNRAIKSANAGAVHDLRVAIRRFTQAIAVCRPYLRAPELRKNRKRLKKVMTEAGEVRNCDVALKLVARFHVPNAVHLRTKLQARRKESVNLLVAELRKWTGRQMSLKWRDAFNTAPADSPTKPVRDIANKALGRIAKDFRKQGSEASSPEASPDRLHRFRIASKKFRYALELFQPLYGSSLDPVIENIKGLSALLGDINDCVTVGEMVSDYKGGNKLADRLRKRQHKKTVEFRNYWKEQFSRRDPLGNTIDEAAPAKKPATSTRFASRSAAEATA